MNLELLDSSKRQLPDRVDATLSLPSSLHLHKKKGGKGGQVSGTWKVANCVAFNRRGTYIAVGYESGTVAIFDSLSRTLCALYRSTERADNVSSSLKSDPDIPQLGNSRSHNSVTFLSWSGMSRTLLAGSAGEGGVQLIDTTHPYGPEESSAVARKDEKDKSEKGDEETKQTPADDNDKRLKRLASPLFNKPLAIHLRNTRFIGTEMMPTTEPSLIEVGRPTGRRVQEPACRSCKPRYPILKFSLPKPIGGSLQCHPRDSCAGIATLLDGSLVAFWVPIEAWEQDLARPHSPSAQVAVLYSGEQSDISCACFDPQGEQIYAGTNSGKLMGFEIAAVFDNFSRGAPEIPTIKPSFVIHVPGGASISNVVTSRNGSDLVLNSADSRIRLYATKECWTTPRELEKPTWVFQDASSKIHFCSCDFSGNGEVVLAGANSGEKEYSLYMWNRATGELLDKLNGAPLELKGISYHPTRSFLAVAASDGLVDIWGPQINWTAFAPNFEALPANTEYVECEDEFDLVEDPSEYDKTRPAAVDEDGVVDVLTVRRAPEFASDSEDENDVFTFGAKVKPMFGIYSG